MYAATLLVLQPWMRMAEASPEPLSPRGRPQALSNTDILVCYWLPFVTIVTLL